ncbi:hypothetical protein ACS0TY_018127 [Phlomoides rotata]
MNAQTRLRTKINSVQKALGGKMISVNDIVIKLATVLEEKIYTVNQEVVLVNI